LSAFPVGETSDVFAGAAKRGVWPKLAQAVDAYCARRFERTVSDIALRRSKRDLARCWRLVRKPAAVRIGGGAGRSRGAQHWT
jgi:hypothetical protein